MLFKEIMVNPNLVEDVFKAEPAWEDILSKIWELDEQVDLQRFATFLIKFFMNQLADMRGYWESRTGKQMSPKEEALVFGNPKILAKITALSYFIEYIEGIAKMQNLSNLMGLGKFGPISNNKNCRGARNGGKKRAINMKEEKIKLQRTYLALYERQKKRTPNLKDTQIYKIIALNQERSLSHVYKVVKGYQSPKKK